MARDFDPYRLASPQVYLWRMIIFLIIAAFVAVILYRQVYVSFLANPALNGVIFAVLFIGILLGFRQVIRIFPEVRWVNNFRTAERSVELERPPVLLAPMAAILGDRIGRMSISTQTMRSVLDSILMRLDEDRDTSRYLTGLLIFLGLLGTFWGLLQTVGAVANAIGSLNVGSGDSAVIFEDLKAGLQAPLAGMGTAFSSSLFGLSGSLILGFLDLQAGQAQNKFYTELEDWLSTVTDLDPSMMDVREGTNSGDDLRVAIERLTQAVQEGSTPGQSGGSNQRATTAMANLAEGIQGLVQHMRSEQQVVRSWVEQQSDQQREIQQLLEVIARALKQPAGE
ncbi:flagellar motor protein MotA [Kaistia algarum]|uniref:flagellar motor protein MotA n=1 Tax=Kaistia algarum TaxID=2083279 RepID=UPI0014025466|nr:flagellar motor protein MotA [Kaistia algarum]MCX5516369.1 flagellar motor protein MotA [Kaistia algarum]